MFEGVQIPEEASIRRAANCILDCHRANDTQEKAGPMGNNIHPLISRNLHYISSWEKPEVDFLKLNSNANLSVDGCWGLGAIIRNHQGEIMAAASSELAGFSDVGTAEAFTLYKAMIFWPEIVVFVR